MKKTAVCMAAAALVLTALLGGCAAEESFTAQTYTAEGEVVSVSIDVSDRAVEVAPSEDGKLHIAYYESEKQSYKIELTGEGALTVRLDLDREWTDFIGTQAAVEYRTLRVELPSDLTALSVVTTNENVTMSDVTVSESVAVSVNGGDISFGKVSVGTSLSLTVKNGNITGSVAGGWDDFTIDCAVKKGESTLPEHKDGGSKTLSVDCNNGDVTIDLANA